MSVSKQVTIVTGGGGNIGVGLVRALAKAGAIPIAVDLDPSAAEAAARQITCDVADPAAAAAMVDEVVGEFGGVDTLINAAQWIHINVPFLEITEEDMRLSFDTGPTATLRLMQLCHPHFKARGGGAVINFASGQGTMGTVGSGPYSAAKEAIRGLTKVAANEWGADNIRINAVCPLGASPRDTVSQATREYLDTWVDIVPLPPLGRIGDAERDIGALILYLASPDCYMTGRTFQIDGGAGMFM
jgi:NAD(P)-dependent dehydrogenase (short-subunit alcohol dehydrogenase family)